MILQLQCLQQGYHKFWFLLFPHHCQMCLLLSLAQQYRYISEEEQINKIKMKKESINILLWKQKKEE